MDLAARRALLQRHGDFAMAHATLDPGLQAYVLEGIGYQAFARHGRSILGLFNPVCAGPDRQRLLAAFLEQPGALGLVQVDEATARLARRMGLRTHRMGVETTLAVPGFSLRGAAMRMVREARNRGRRLGFRIAEIGREVPATAATWERLRRISGEWMTTRTVTDREVGVMMRQSVFAAEAGCRKYALLDSAGLIQGYQVYDPIPAAAGGAGYTLSFARFAACGLKGRHYFMTCGVLERLREEGCRRLELGLSPLYRVAEPDPLSSSRLVQAVLHRCYRHGGRLYGFRGLALHKRKYRGREEPCYLVSRSRWPLSMLVRLLLITGVVGWRRQD